MPVMRPFFSGPNHLTAAGVAAGAEELREVGFERQAAVHGRCPFAQPLHEVVGLLQG